MTKTYCLLLLMFGLLADCFSQNLSLPQDDEQNALNKKRLNTVILSESVLYAGSMTGLYFLWYVGYPQSNFHFINDNAEWLQMDKLGHATCAYTVGEIGYDLLQYSGVNRNKSIVYGGTLGFLFLTTVEVFDGFSAEWGASWGDLAANAVGTGLFVGQQLLWDEQRIALKMSYHNTKYSNYRPDLLGENTLQSILKDYNGETFWLSFNINSFLKDESRFPKWLNFAVGYGAEGMTGGHTNVLEHNGNPIPFFERERQFYLSPDIDLSRIQVKNPTLKTIMKVLNFIKIPMPAIEFNSKSNTKFHWLYF